MNGEWTVRGPDGGKLEWASFGLHTIFAQKKNLLSPSFYLMIADVLRFNRKAPEVRLQPPTPTYDAVHAVAPAHGVDAG